MSQTVAPGILYIVSAPSGGGKTSLVTKLIETFNDLAVAVSHTTRAPREGEVEDKHYHYISDDEFKQMIADDAFLEYAEVFGNYYGTSRAHLEERLSNGEDIILEIDWQGAQQVRKLMPDTISVFILPPSRQILLNRLKNRGQDSPDVVAARSAEAMTEMRHYNEYDFVVINDDFKQALAELTSIFRSQRLRTPIQAIRHGNIIRDLLE